MLLKKSSITNLAGEGRITLQIPQYEIVVDEDGHLEYTKHKDNAFEGPDEWFVYLKALTPTVGKEMGFLFLTRAGWEANKDIIKKAFEGAEFKRGTWQDFEDHADDHFNKVQINILRKIKLLEGKLTELRNKKV